MTLDELKEILASKPTEPSGFKLDYERVEVEARLLRAISRVMDNDRRLLEHGPNGQSRIGWPYTLNTNSLVGTQTASTTGKVQELIVNRSPSIKG